MTREDAHICIAHVEGAALRLAEAMTTESALEDERALVKVAGIQRLMDLGPNPLTGKPHSVSSAEAIIEQDFRYMEHRVKQRQAVANTILFRAKLKAAELRAQFAVELAAIDALAQEVE